MSFDSLERSIQDAAPQELFRFSYADNVFAYTSGDVAVTFNGDTYAPFPISRGPIRKSSNIEAVQLEIVAEASLPFAEIFRVQAPLDTIRVVIYQYFSPTEYSVIWRGRVGAAHWQGSEVNLTSDNVFTSIRRIGLRRMVQYQCPLALYGAECGVLQSNWETVTAASSVGNTTLTVPYTVGRPDNYYAGGKVSWNRDGVTESRLIRSSVGASGVLTVAGFIIGLAPSQEIRLYPGCDHSTGSNGCAKFNNQANFGGFPFMPEAPNPFGNGNIW